ncbi:MAG: hypothetical protein J7485_00835 [Sphingobium sp.]|nr:hypothetical protein [Sphingobium sp.]
MTQYIEHDLGGPEVHAVSASSQDRAAESGVTAAAPAKAAALKKLGHAMADPIAHALKAQEPATLAKMAAAVIAPRLLKSALRMAVRHPFLSVAGIAGLSAWALQKQPTAQS